MSTLVSPEIFDSSSAVYLPSPPGAPPPLRNVQYSPYHPPTHQLEALLTGDQALPSRDKYEHRDQNTSHYLSGGPGEVTPLDHHIAKQRGTTSNLENQVSRIRESKKNKRVNPFECIKELTWEISYLRKELAMYKKTQAAMWGLHEATIKADQTLRIALEKLSRTMAKSGRELEEYWGIHHEDHSEETRVF